LVIASRDAEKAKAMASSFPSKSAEIRAADSVRAAVQQADAVLTLTSSPSPVIDPEDFREGMIICGMGEHGELPSELFQTADSFVVDDIGFAKVMGSVASWIRNGEVSEEEIDTRATTKLGEIVARIAPGRVNAKQRILAIVQGLAIADLAIAKICADKAHMVEAVQSMPFGRKH
jgi:ornithine cyclodeaminase/alanine dehydrogenase-like protein (mu-crystallin family)